jgi:Protein of unknown function (DUF2806)
LPLLEDGASPQNIEDDWIAHFFDRCRLISDEEMQALWSKVLAGEANSPGRYSKRTVNLISSLDKADAELLKKLCSFAWKVRDVVPLVYDHNDGIYVDNGLYFDALRHLQEIGLISFEPLGYHVKISAETCSVYFCAKSFEIEFPGPTENTLEVGNVLLTKAGQELASISELTPCPGFQEYVIARWRSIGLRVKEVN